MTSSSTSPARRRLSAAAVASIAVVALYTVGQIATGAAIVATHGVSMLPTYETGDLVIVRPAASYRVGDAVAYRSASLDAVVLHRIVAVEGDTFVFQGDNNMWLDSEKPTLQQLVGKHWLHIPRGAIWLRRAASPPVLAGSGFALISSGGAVANRSRRRRKDLRKMSDSARQRPLTTRWSPAGPAQEQPTHPRSLTPRAGRRRDILRALAAGVAVLGLAALSLAAVAWSRPAVAVVSTEQSVTSTTQFTYSATVRPSPAYDRTTVTAPQPIFRKLTESVDVTFSYAGPPGTVAVDARLSAPSGWSSTVPLAEPVTFEEDDFTGTVTLDLPALQQRADAAAKATGIPVSNVSVAVVPTFTVRGGAFAPELQFTLDPLALRLTQAAASGDGSATQPLRIEESTAISSMTRQPAQLGAFGRGIPVLTARTASTVTLAVAALLALILGVMARRTLPLSEPQRINLRYAQILLPVEPIVLQPGRPVIDVPSIDSLVKLAQRYGLLVLHWSRSDVATYIVQDEGTTYRFRSGAPQTACAATDNEAAAALTGTTL